MSYQPPKGYGAYQPPGYPGQPGYPGGFAPSPSGTTDPDDLRLPFYGCGPIVALKRYYRSYVCFSGRASRAEYWWVALYHCLVFFVVGLPSIIFAVSLSEDPEAPSQASSISMTMLVIFGFVLWWLIHLLPNLALAWRRLHDAGMAGPMYFLSWIPYVGDIILFILTLLGPKFEGQRFDQFVSGPYPPSGPYQDQWYPPQQYGAQQYGQYSGPGWQQFGPQPYGPQQSGPGTYGPHPYESREADANADPLHKDGRQPPESS